MGKDLYGREDTHQNSDIDLGPIKGTITRVELPRNTLRGSGKLIEGFLEARLSPVPRLDLAHELFRAGGQLQPECEPQHAVEGAHKVEKIVNLLLDLVLAADWHQLGRASHMCLDGWEDADGGNVQICASSCWNLLTLVKPLSAPLASFL